MSTHCISTAPELDPPPDPVVSWVQNLQLPLAAPAPSPSPRAPAPSTRPPGPPGSGREQPGPGAQEAGAECVSMESMVALDCPNLTAHYRAGLHHLKSAKVHNHCPCLFLVANVPSCLFQFTEAIKSLETVRKAVVERPSYGEYVIYK